MDKSDLIKRLEHVEVPHVELQGHRMRLRRELLSSGRFQERPEDFSGIWRVAGLARSFVIGQPKWRSVASGVMVLALIVALVLTVPTFDGKSNAALAEEIARNSDVFRVASLGVGEITVERVIEQADGKALVKFATEKGTRIGVQVDLEAGEAKFVGVRFAGLEMSEAEEALAIEVAKADHRVQDILDQGMTIQMIRPAIVQKGKVINLVLLPEDRQEDNFPEGKSVQVDIDRKEVISIDKFDPRDTIRIDMP